MIGGGQGDLTHRDFHLGVDLALDVDAGAVREQGFCFGFFWEFVFGCDHGLVVVFRLLGAR